MRLTRVPVIIALVLGSVAAPLALDAQPPTAKPWRIGVLTYLYPPDADPPQAFRQRLQDLGYRTGQNIVIDWRYGGGHEDRMPALASELVGLKPDLLVADATLAVQAALAATATTPIVMMGAADPVGVGLVSNLAHPGGRVTGGSLLLSEMSGKRLQLLKEAAPRASRVAVLINPSTTFHRATLLKEVEAAAPALRLHLVIINVRSRDDLGDALAEVTRARVDALFVSETMTPTARKQLVEFAARSRLPAMFLNRDYVTAGGLMSYGPNFSDVFGHAAEYVDKILKGAQPGDLPVEQTSKFELVINQKTARALGLTLSPSILARADLVVQ